MVAAPTLPYGHGLLHRLPLDPMFRELPCPTTHERETLLLQPPNSSPIQAPWNFKGTTPLMWTLTNPN